VLAAHGSMSLFRRFFYRRPPDGLLEITERVYGERKICVCFFGWGGEGRVFVVSFGFLLFVILCGFQIHILGVC
jgi:hypothetical protein